MPTPKHGYHLKDGTKIPGTTTIISRFKDAGGLLHWAFKQGQSGKATLYEEAEKAADIGTCAHNMVEMHLDGKGDTEIEQWAVTTLPDPESSKKAISSFQSYRAWSKNFNVQIVEREMQLVSELHRFGGTPDAIGIINDQLVLLDWKTSNAVYLDYLIQLAAYRQLWEENHPDKPITGGFHLLRFAKEYGDFAHHYFPNLDSAWRQFVLFREAFEIDKELKKRAA